MVCPYCQKEMSRGYITRKSSSVIWNPIGEKRGVFIFPGLSKNGIVITYNKDRTAYLCRSCNKMIIDFNE